MTFKIDTNFQTPPVVAAYMAEMARKIRINDSHLKRLLHNNVLEPTPGTGNLVAAINDVGRFVVYAPGYDKDFWTHWVNTHKLRYEFVIMNPPFNPVAEMERFVNRAMELSDNVIALLPWTYLINSDRRLMELMGFGLVSVTALPRKTFPGCRVQVAIFELKKGYAGRTEFKRFSW